MERWIGAIVEMQGLVGVVVSFVVVVVVIVVVFADVVVFVAGY